MLAADCSLCNTRQCKENIVTLHSLTRVYNYPFITDEETKALGNIYNLLRFIHLFSGRAWMHTMSVCLSFLSSLSHVVKLGSEKPTSLFGTSLG